MFLRRVNGNPILPQLIFAPFLLTTHIQFLSNMQRLTSAHPEPQPPWSQPPSTLPVSILYTVARQLPLV